MPVLTHTFKSLAGLNVEDADVVFPAYDVISFMKRSVPVDPESSILFMALDPSGGGDSSTSIVTLSLMKNTLVVVCVDEQPVKGVVELERMLIGHVERLRQSNAYPDHWICAFFESNLGQESAHMEAMLQRHRIKNLWVMHEKEKTGVLTTNTRKELYADRLKYFLSQRCIGWRQGGVLTGNPNKGEPERIRGVMMEQLSNYRRVTLEAAPGRVARWQFSGKVCGSRQDDACLTLQLCSYWATRFAARSIPGVDYAIFNSSDP